MKAVTPATPEAAKPTAVVQATTSDPNIRPHPSPLPRGEGTSPHHHGHSGAHTLAQPFGWQMGWRYGLMGLPLAFVALPLYVLLPNHYAREFGLSLTSLGALLLAVRLFDTVIDPWLGRCTDHLFARSPAAVLRWGALAAVLLCVGFALMFFPPKTLSAPVDERLQRLLTQRTRQPRTILQNLTYTYDQ